MMFKELINVIFKYLIWFIIALVHMYIMHIHVYYFKFKTLILCKIYISEFYSNCYEKKNVWIK